MEAAAPPRLSGLAKLLLRRPPSLRELVTLIGYADDYAWFAGLVRHLFPDEGEEVLAAPDVRERVERFARLFAERHFPLYASYIDLYWDEGDEPPFTWLRRGIPFELFGFGYDGIHEIWDRYRDGLSALALLARPPEACYVEPDGIRVAWLEAAAERIPQETLLRIPEGRHTPGHAHRGAGGDAVRRGGAGREVGLGRGPGNFFLDASFDDGEYEGFSDPWDDDLIAQGHRGVAPGHGPHGRGGPADRLAGGGAPRPLRRDAGVRPGAAPFRRKGG